MKIIDAGDSYFWKTFVFGLLLADILILVAFAFIAFV